MAGVVAPDVEAAGDAFVAKDLRHTFVVVPALVVDTGGKKVGVAPIAVEIPGIADVGQVVHGDIEVAVVVVVAGEEAGGVEGAAHREHRSEDVGVAEGDVEGVIATEAGANGGKLNGLVLLANQRQNLLHQVLLVLHVTGDAPARRDVAVVPAFGVDRVDAEQLQAPLFEFVMNDVDHAAILKLEEAAAGGGKDERRNSRMAEDEQFHVAPKRGGEPFVVFAFHCLPLCYSDAIVLYWSSCYRIGTFYPIFFQDNV